MNLNGLTINSCIMEVWTVDCGGLIIQFFIFKLEIQEICNQKGKNYS